MFYNFWGVNTSILLRKCSFLTNTARCCFASVWLYFVHFAKQWKQIKKKGLFSASKYIKKQKQVQATLQDTFYINFKVPKTA